MVNIWFLFFYGVEVILFSSHSCSVIHIVFSFYPHCSSTNYTETLVNPSEEDEADLKNKTGDEIENESEYETESESEDETDRSVDEDGKESEDDDRKESVGEDVQTCDLQTNANMEGINKFYIMDESDDDMVDTDDDGCDHENNGVFTGDDQLLLHFTDHGLKTTYDEMEPGASENVQELASAASDASETINTSVHESEFNVNRTIIGETTMQWENVTDDNYIEIGDPSLKVGLPDGYYKDFVNITSSDQHLSLVKDDKFICSYSQIKLLLSALRCEHQDCRLQLKVASDKFVGSVYVVSLACENGHKKNWASSAMVNNVYAVNFQWASSCVLSGGLYVKQSLMAKFLSLKVISSSTFYRIQKLYVAPSVDHWWINLRNLLFRLLEGRSIWLAEDGRNDSPGHSATYCVNSFMEIDSKFILHQELVDTREAALKSPNMERLGFEQGLDYIRTRKEVKVIGVVTDDHKSISCLLEKDDKYKEVTHQKDIYHKATKISKKLNQV